MRTDFADFPPPVSTRTQRRGRFRYRPARQRWAWVGRARPAFHPAAGIAGRYAPRTRCRGAGVQRTGDPRRVSAGQGRADAQARKADDAQAGKATERQRASGKASPDKPSRERDASGDKPSDITPDAGASDTDSPPPARKLKAMGAVSLITLMRTGSAGNRGEALENRAGRGPRRRSRKCCGG